MKYARLIFGGIVSSVIGFFTFWIQVELPFYDGWYRITQTAILLMYLFVFYAAGRYFTAKGYSRWNKWVFFLMPACMCEIGYMVPGYSAVAQIIGVILMGIICPFAYLLVHLNYLPFDPLGLVPKVLPIFVCFVVYMVGEYTELKRGGKKHEKTL